MHIICKHNNCNILGVSDVGVLWSLISIYYIVGMREVWISVGFDIIDFFYTYHYQKLQE